MSKWTDKTVVEVLESLYNNSEYSDIQFKFEKDGNHLPAHSLIFLIKSPVFYEQFIKNKRCMDYIEVPSYITHSAFTNFVKFIYTNDCTVTDENINELLELAKQYEMTELNAKCLKWMKEKLTIDNACSFLDIALTKNYLLRADVVEFIRLNYCQVIVTEGFVNTNRTVVEAILNIENVSCGSEFELFKALFQWLGRQQAQPDNKKTKREIIGNLIKLIRFPTMKSEEFAICAVMEEDFLTTHEISTVFLEIHKKLKNPYEFSNRMRNELYLYLQPTIFNAPPELIVGDHPNFVWVYDKPSMETKFTVTKPISLLGVHVTGSNVDTTVHVYLMNEHNGIVIDGVGPVGKNNYTKIDFNLAVQLKPNRQYSLVFEYDTDSTTFWCYHSKTTPLRLTFANSDGTEIVFSEVSRMLHKIFYQK